jgi:hypothetical protein
MVGGFGRPGINITAATILSIILADSGILKILMKLLRVRNIDKS